MHNALNGGRAGARRVGAVALCAAVMIPATALAQGIGLAQGVVLENSGTSSEHETPSGWPRRWLDVGVPIKVRFNGVGQCAYRIRVVADRNDTLMHEDQTAVLKLPADYATRFVVRSAHVPVRLAIEPVAKPGAPCSGPVQKFEARTLDHGNRHMLVQTLKVDPVLVPFAPDGAGSLQFDVGGYGEATCPLTVRVSGGRETARTFTSAPVKLPGRVTINGMAKELRGMPSGTYTVTVEGGGSGKQRCVGEATAKVELEASQPALLAVTPSQGTYYSFKSDVKQAFTVTVDRPSAVCDVRVRVMSRSVENQNPLPVTQDFTIPNAKLPLTVTEGQLGFQRVALSGDSMSHMEVIPLKGCRPSQSVQGDFGVQGQPNGGPVGLEIPTIQGLQPSYSGSQSISFSVGFPGKSPSPYAASGFGCCEVQTFVLDNNGGWLKQSSVDKPADSSGAIAFTSGYFTSAQFPKKPWLIRVRGYKQGLAPAWSAPVRFEIK